MSETHPSIGKALRWVLVAESSDRFDSAGSVDWADRMIDAGCDAVVLDQITASNIAPGVRARPHAVVVHAWRERRGHYPSLVVVAPSYDRLSPVTPSGLVMVDREGAAIGDAIAVARCSGLRIDSVAVPVGVLKAYEANECLDRDAAWSALWRAAMVAMKATLPRQVDDKRR